MRTISRYLIAAIFVTAGVVHLVKPKPFVEIVPPQLPSPDLLVLISGVEEILGGVGILLPRTQKMAGWGLMVLLVAVFPANVYMAQAHIVPTGMSIPPAALWARLLLQPMLIWWVYAATQGPKQVKAGPKPGLHLRPKVG